MKRIIKIFITTTISTLFIFGITLFAISNADNEAYLPSCPSTTGSNNRGCMAGTVWCPTANRYINRGDICNNYLYCSNNTQYYYTQSDYNNYCNKYTQYCSTNGITYYNQNDYNNYCTNYLYNSYNQKWCPITSSYISNYETCSPNCTATQQWDGNKCVERMFWCSLSNSYIRQWETCANVYYNRPIEVNINNTNSSGLLTGINYNNNPYNYNQSNTTSISPNYSINNNVITPNGVNNYSYNSNSTPSYSLNTQSEAYFDISDDSTYSDPIVISYVPVSNYKSDRNRDEDKEDYYKSSDTSIKLKTANKNKVALSVNGKSLTQDNDNTSSTGSNPIMVGGPIQYQGQIPPSANNMGGQFNYPQMTGYNNKSNNISKSFTPNTILQWVGLVLMLIVLFLLGDYVYNKKKRLG